MTSLVAAVLMVAVQQDSTIEQLRRVVPEVSGRNGYEEYIRAAIVFERSGGSEAVEAVEAARGSEQFLGMAQTLVSRNRETFSLILEGNRKAVVHPQIATADLATELPELGVFRGISELYGLKAEVQTAEGNIRGLYSDWMESVIFARQISGSGILINFLVGDALLMSAMERLTEMAPPDLQSCGQMMTNLTALSQTNAVVASLRGEQAFMQRFLASADFDSLRDSFLSEDEAGRLPRETLEAALREYVQTNGELTAAVERAYQLPESQWLTNLSAVLVDFANVPSLTDSLKVDGSMAWNMTLNELHARTQMRLARLHLGVWQHRWRNGDFPDSTGALRSTELTIDPLSGEAFRIEIEDGRVTVSSPGNGALGEIRLGERSGMPGRRGNDGFLPPSSLSGRLNGG